MESKESTDGEDTFHKFTENESLTSFLTINRRVREEGIIVSGLKEPYLIRDAFCFCFCFVGVKSERKHLSHRLCYFRFQNPFRTSFREASVVGGWINFSCKKNRKRGRRKKEGPYPRITDVETVGRTLVLTQLKLLLSVLFPPPYLSTFCGPRDYWDSTMMKWITI